MSSEVSQVEPEIRAQVVLLKAYMKQKTKLNFEISQMKIAKSYKNSNSDYRDIRDLGSQIKLLSKRLNEVKGLRNFVNSMKIKQVSSETLEEIQKFTPSLDLVVETPNGLCSVNNDLEACVSFLKSTLDSLDQEYSIKNNEFHNNQALITENTESLFTRTKLESEVKDYKAEIEIYYKENSGLNRKREFLRNKRNSVDKVKIFHQLTDGALVLRSKLLLRDELKKNFADAERELMELERKVNEQQEIARQQEINDEREAKISSRLETELCDWRNSVKNAEKKLENLRMIKSCLFEVDGKGKRDLHEESKLLNYSPLSDSFGQIHKENTSLFEENEKLKSRISKLFSSKS